MPIYEYQCNDCSAHHEFMQKISEKPKTACPDCGGKLHKLISLNSFQLKGGGWYADGYGSKRTCESKQPDKGTCSASCDGTPVKSHQTSGAGASANAAS